VKTEKTKVLFRNVHVAYVNAALKARFQQLYGVRNYVAWVREEAYETFGLRLEEENGLRALQAAVSERYYGSVGEWLDEKMRQLVLMKK